MATMFVYDITGKMISHEYSNTKRYKCKPYFLNLTVISYMNRNINSKRWLTDRVEWLISNNIKYDLKYIFDKKVANPLSGYIIDISNKSDAVLFKMKWC